MLNLTWDQIADGDRGEASHYGDHTSDIWVNNRDKCGEGDIERSNHHVLFHRKLVAAVKHIDYLGPHWVVGNWDANEENKDNGSNSYQVHHIVIRTVNGLPLEHNGVGEFEG